MITIKIKGLKRTERMIARLPKTMEKEIMKVSEQFMEIVKKSARMRAPKDTGFLADQIDVEKKGNEITLDTGEAYYAYYQEFGFKPHFMPSEYFKQHKMAPNIPGRPVAKPTRFIMVSKNKPFLIPALEVGLSYLPNMLEIGAQKGAQKSKR